MSSLAFRSALKTCPQSVSKNHPSLFKFTLQIQISIAFQKYQNQFTNQNVSFNQFQKLSTFIGKTYSLHSLLHKISQSYSKTFALSFIKQNRCIRKYHLRN
jgi:monomeric isocitrate dehydrogenase